MVFLNPIMLGIGLAAMALPVAIHLLFRQRARAIPFSTLRFLVAADRRVTRLSRIRALVLLLLRMAVLALIALALAQPLAKGPILPGSDVRRARVVVLDNSASMNRKAQGRSPFDHAVEAAARLVEDLERGDSAGFITTSEARAGGKPVVTGNRDALLARLTALEPGRGSGDPDGAFTAAMESVEKTSGAIREVVFLSDLQRLHWDPFLANREALGSSLLPEDLRLTFLSPPSPEGGNLTLMEAEAFPVPGGQPETRAVRVKVGNAGAELLESRLSLWVDGERLAVQPIDLAPRQEASFQFTVQPDQAGVHRGMVELGPDLLAEDNQRFFLFETHKTVQVLLASGAEDRPLYDNPLFYLTRALDPPVTGAADRPFILHHADLDELARLPLQEYAAVILSDPPAVGAEGTAMLKAYVEAGGGLMVLAGSEGYDPASLDALGDLLPFRDYSIHTVPSGEAGFRLDAVMKEHPILQALAAVHPPLDLGRARFSSYLRAVPDDGVGVSGGGTAVSGKDGKPVEASWQILARFRSGNNGEGDPALAEGRIGRGKVLLFLNGCAPGSTDFPLKVSFLPFLHSALTHLMRHVHDLVHLEVGDPMVGPIRDESTWVEIAEVIAEEPEEETSSGWTGLSHAPDTGSLFESVDAAQAGETGDGASAFRPKEPGFYRHGLQGRGGAGAHPAWYAVNIDPGEGDLHFLDAENVAMAFEEGGGASFSDPAAAAALLETEGEQKAEFYGPLLILALGLLLIEAFAANRGPAAAAGTAARTVKKPAVPMGMPSVLALSLPLGLWFLPETEVQFQGTLAPAAAAVLLIGILVLAALAYGLLVRRRPKGSLFGPAFLRMAALTVLVLLILRPEITQMEQGERSDRVAVLLDVSQSMGVQDSLEGSGRLQAAQRLLFNGPEGLVSRLEASYQVDLFTFGRMLQPVTEEGARTAEAVAPATRLQGALEALALRYGGEDLAGAVLFTDGRENGTGLGAGSIDRYAAPLHTVGLGIPEEAPVAFLDAAVTALACDGKVRTGDRVVVQGRCTVTPGGAAPQVTVHLLVNGEVHHTESISLDVPAQAGSATGVATAEFTFPWVPRTSGVHELGLRVAALEGEGYLDNNLRTRPVEVSSKGMEVLCFEAMPRWEFKFLRRTLTGDRKINFTGLIRTGPDRYLQQGKAPVDLANGLPAALDDLGRFDCIILGDVERSDFPPGVMEALRRYVEEGIGGLILSAGPHGSGPAGLRDTPLSPALPVNFEGSPSPIRSALSVAPTGWGTSHPLLDGIDLDPAGLQGALDAFFPPGSLKPGSQVLARSRSGPTGPIPFLVVHRYGKGRCAAVLSDATWNWAMEGTAQHLHHRFWRRLVRWASGRDGEDVTRLETGPLMVSRLLLAPGERAKVTVVRGDMLPGGSPGGLPMGSLEGETELKTPVAFQAGEEGAVAWIEPVGSGFHTLRVSERSGTPIGAARIYVHREFREQEGIHQDRDLLERMAASSGGAYYTPLETDAIPEDILEKERSLWARTPWRLEESPLAYLIVVALLSSEWIRRRRSGMV